MTDLVSRAGAEVTDLHSFFQAWFNGRVANNAEIFSRVECVWGPKLVLVSPSGEVLNQGILLQNLQSDYCCSASLRIEIRNIQAHEVSSETVVAIYEEWHLDTDETEGRLCSAVLREADSTPFGLEWIHIHESPHANA